MNVIELQGVSVRYRQQKIGSFKEALVHGHLAAAKSFVYSVRDVSLIVGAGESVGVIGSNGAGKSTLLRVAAGIVSPSEGVVVSRGSFAPVLELGTGFEAEFSGRENIYFNGALLGCSRAYMRTRVDDIIALSGLGHVIDSPLRTYSTGMVARLAFAVATDIDAETILLDEILAVGDVAFREQCDARIARFVKKGATVMVVSHDLQAIERLCSRVICMSRGRLVDDGPAAEVIARYRESEAAKR